MFKNCQSPLNGIHHQNINGNSKLDDSFKNLADSKTLLINYEI